MKIEWADDTDGIWHCTVDGKPYGKATNIGTEDEPLWEFMVAETAEGLDWHYYDFDLMQSDVAQMVGESEGGRA